MISNFYFNPNDEQNTMEAFNAEGAIHRIKKHKCVVIEVKGICAVAIAFIPFNGLELN